MIRCEHCGSTLPDGAIFCGECGRAVTAAANRRPVAPTPVEQAPPPPLQQPDVHGSRPDPAAEPWLPESTLDPATRAWLTGGDRRTDEPSAAVPVQRPDDLAPRAAPSHVHGAGSGLDGWPAPQPPREVDAPVEPPLDPDAYPDATSSDEVDPEVTRVTERAGSGTSDDPTVVDAVATSPVEAAPVDAAPEQPRWAPPVQQTPTRAPSAPSWWVGRANAASGSDAASAPTDGATDGATDESEQDESPVVPPRPGDTAVVEPLVDRRPPRPTPLVAPGTEATTCHVCGHRLEPDDIFCAECGAVRPAVTAAFTGPVVPLPMARPDWAADDSAGPEEPDSDVAGGDPADPVVPPTDGAGDAPAVGSDDVAQQPGADDGRAGTPSDGTDSATAEARSGDAGGSGGTIAEDTPRTPIRTRGAHAAVQHDTPPAGTSVPSIPPIPGSATVPSSAPRVDDTSAMPVAPLPPVPGGTGPVLPPTAVTVPPTSAEPEVEDDVDETRIVAKTPTRAPFLLHFSTGERLGVHGTGLLGRLPRPQPGERFDDLLTVHDPGKSVSKTHLEFGRDGDDLWVSDRFSGNGTVIRHIDGSIRRCEPGRRYRVERGARVDIGEQFFLVQ